MDEFRLLVLTDAHNDSLADPSAPTGRNCRLGNELVHRAINDALRLGGFDAIAIMGDMVDRGQLSSAADDLQAVAAEIARAVPGVPVLAVSGNHDGHAQRFKTIFGQSHDVVELGGYRFILFSEVYAEGDYATRPASQLARLRELAAGGGPIIALQHNPMNPPIVSDYPYMLVNRDEVMEAYRQCGVLLSISGHYHAGQALSRHGQVSYVTVPALCEKPFFYAIVRLRDREVGVEFRRLEMPSEAALIDSHVHTEFAFCGAGVKARQAIERAGAMGLAGLCLVEHAPQLYCSKEDFWPGTHIRVPSLWRNRTADRMSEFRRQILPLRSSFVRVGLEVELDADGQITLHEEDRDGLDLLLGAVHFLPTPAEKLSDAQLKRQFLAATEGLLRSGIDILAHPLRLFRWAKRATPASVFEPLADMLAESGVAAEINLHHNDPNEEFFALCSKRGVRLALGSDAHTLSAVGGFWPHLEMLRRIAGSNDVRPLLWKPRG